MKTTKLIDALRAVKPQWVRASVEVGEPVSGLAATERAIDRYEQVWGGNELSRMFRSLLEKRGVSLYDRKLEHHFTGSVMVVSAKSHKVLLTFHPYYQIWQWLGGHDEGEHDPVAVASREAAEESGIEDLWVLDVPVRIDPHPSYQCRTVPGTHKNYHYDICYMAVAPDERFVISDESEDMQWFDLVELEGLVREGKAQERHLEAARSSLVLLGELTKLGDLPPR